MRKAMKMQANKLRYKHILGKRKGGKTEIFSSIDLRLTVTGVIKNVIRTH